MAEQAHVVAELRERAGKGVARATRRSGRVPAVIYGDSKEPVMISLDGKELAKMASNPAFFNHLVRIDVGGQSHEVLPRDVQLDAVSDRVIHVDFLRVSPTTRITVMIPAEFVGQDKCPGLRRGGVLNIVRREVEMRCAPRSIPEKLTFSLEGLDIGASIHIDAIDLPEGVSPTTTRNFTVATIAPPTVAAADEKSDAAAAAAASAAAAPAAAAKKD
jgi:large subunit ribosomal protein L25